MTEDVSPISRIPETGESSASLLRRLEVYAERDRKRWSFGQCSGSVYHGGVEHQRTLDRAFSLFSVSNPLHADVWPSVAQFERDVVAMTADLLGGRENKDVVGCVTSGGTESIFCSVKSHLFRAKHHRVGGRVEQRPFEIVCCTTKHAALDKACDILGIRLVETPPNPSTFEMDVGAVRAAISDQTIMIFASAPSYPQGIIDPIEALGRLAVRRGVGLHVDACLGGFYLPFLRTFKSVRLFDFAVPGVSSMSADCHKYGNATKGTSVVLYCNDALRRWQYFAYPDWSGGMYVTPTLAGSKNGGLSAAAYASMVSIGRSGYIQLTRQMDETVQIVLDAARNKCPGLEVLGTPTAMIVAVKSDVFNIYQWQKRVSKLGFSWSACQNPRCVHLAVTNVHVGKGHDIARAMQRACEVLSEQSVANASNAQDGPNIYGVASSSSETTKRRRRKKERRDLDASLRAYMSGVLGGAMAELRSKI